MKHGELITVICIAVCCTLASSCTFESAVLEARQCSTDVDCASPLHVCLEGYCGTPTSAASCLSDPSQCDNGAFCDGVERCLPDAPGADASGCVAGDPVDVEDGVDCTVGRCDESADVVVQDCSECACCGNANPCFEQAAGQCKTWVCTESYGCELEPLMEGAGCDDGAACTSGDLCDGEGSCLGEADDTTCADDLFCNGEERCAPSEEGADEEGCVETALAGLDDGVDCTSDTCDEALDLILHDAVGCVCQRDADCLAQCQTGTCQEGSCVFEPLENGAECDDGIECTRADVCDSLQRCVGVPSNLQCDDGIFCNGDGLCNPLDGGADGRGCVQTARDLSDGVDCTQDSCDEEGSVVLHDASACECQVDEDCVPQSQCEVVRCQEFVCVVGAAQEGTDCDDGMACTGGDTCDGQGVCEGSPDDGLCADDDVCNGTELCTPGDVNADERGCSLFVPDPLPPECLSSPDEIGGLRFWVDASDLASMDLTVEERGHNFAGDNLLLGGEAFVRSEDASPRPGNFFVYQVNFVGAYVVAPTVELESLQGDNTFGDNFDLEVRGVTTAGFEVFVYRTDNQGGGFGKGPDRVEWSTVEPRLVELWADRSGDRHAEQQDAARRPVLDDDGIGGRPSVHFVDDFMDFTRPVRDNMTIAVVFRTTETGASNNWYNCPAIIGGELSGGVNDLGFVMNEGRLGWGAKDNGFDALTNTANEFNDGQAHAAILLRDKDPDGTIVIRVDGVELARGNGVKDRLDRNPFLRLGRHPTTSGRFDGDYAEVIMYDRVLSQAQLEDLEAYLASKWSLPR